MAKKDTSHDDLITTAQAAAELGVSAIRVTQLITQGRLRATKFGHVWSIRRGDLDAVRHRPTGRPRKDAEAASAAAAVVKKKGKK